MTEAPTQTPTAPPPRRRLRRRAGWLVAALAVSLTVVALSFAVSTLVYAVRAGEANGEVIALEAVRDASGEVRVPAQYRAVIEFPDHNGQFRRFTDSSATGTPPAIGSEVKVLFDRKRPSKARLEDYLLLYRNSVIAGAWAMTLGVASEELLRDRSAQQLGPVQLFGKRAR